MLPIWASYIFRGRRNHFLWIRHGWWAIAYMSYAVRSASTATAEHFYDICYKCGVWCCACYKFHKKPFLSAFAPWKLQLHSRGPSDQGTNYTFSWYIYTLLQLVLSGQLLYLTVTIQSQTKKICLHIKKGFAGFVSNIMESINFFHESEISKIMKRTVV